jgi:hypothetical protein
MSMHSYVYSVTCVSRFLFLSKLVVLDTIEIVNIWNWSCIVLEFRIGTLFLFIVTSVKIGSWDSSVGIATISICILLIDLPSYYAASKTCFFETPNLP